MYSLFYSGNWERMPPPTSIFAWLRYVRLTNPIINRYASERPHTWRISKSQINRPVIKQTKSVRFVVKHCPLLVSLHIDPDYSLIAPKKARDFEPLVAAFKELARTCLELETLGVFGRAILIPLDGKGSRDKRRFRSTVDHDFELNLMVIPFCLRDEVVEAWSRATLRESVEYGEVVRFLSPEEWQKKRLDPPPGPVLDPV